MIDEPDLYLYTWDVLYDEDISEIRNRELAEGFFNFSGETGSLSISGIELGGNLIAKYVCATCHKGSGAFIEQSCRTIEVRYRGRGDQARAIGLKYLEIGHG